MVERYGLDLSSSEYGPREVLINTVMNLLVSWKKQRRRNSWLAELPSQEGRCSMESRFGLSIPVFPAILINYLMTFIL